MPTLYDPSAIPPRPTGLQGQIQVVGVELAGKDVDAFTDGGIRAAGGALQDRQLQQWQPEESFAPSLTMDDGDHVRFLRLSCAHQALVGGLGR